MMGAIPENKYGNNVPTLNESSEQEYEALMSESEARRRNRPGTTTSKVSNGISNIFSSKKNETPASDRRRKAK